MSRLFEEEENPPSVGVYLPPGAYRVIGGELFKLEDGFPPGTDGVVSSWGESPSPSDSEYSPLVSDEPFWIEKYA